MKGSVAAQRALNLYLLFIIHNLNVAAWYCWYWCWGGFSLPQFVAASPMKASAMLRREGWVGSWLVGTMPLLAGWLARRLCCCT